MDASCKVQGSIHVFSLVHKYVSRILGTYQSSGVTCIYLIIGHFFEFGIGKSLVHAAVGTDKAFSQGV